MGDAEAIIKDDRPVARVSYLDRQVAQVEYNSQNWSTNVQGVTPSYLPIRNWAVVEGRPLTEDDERIAARVCLLGQTVVKNLFGEHTNPVGAVVRVKNVEMQVAGVLAAKGQSGWGQDQDDVVLIPFSSAERKVLGVAAPTSANPSGTATPSVTNPYARGANRQLDLQHEHRRDQSLRKPAQNGRSGTHDLRRGEKPGTHPAGDRADYADAASPVIASSQTRTTTSTCII